jgi:hypothetical protein
VTVFADQLRQEVRFVRGERPEWIAFLSKPVSVVSNSDGLGSAALRAALSPLDKQDERGILLLTVRRKSVYGG